MSVPSRPSPAYRGPERRRYPRIPAAAVPHLVARVAGGPPVQMLDLSKRGVQIATTMHMRPGSTVSVRFLSGPASVTLTAAVVRSTVERIETGGRLTYHSALAFTDELTLCAEELDAAALASLATQAPAPQPADAPDDYTMILMDGRTGARERVEASPA